MRSNSMNRKLTSVNSSGWSTTTIERRDWPVPLSTSLAWWALALSLVFALNSTPGSSLASTIDMEYSDEGSPLPHPENPSWDPDGSILKRHFEAAKAIWESLLPGPSLFPFAGNYEFDYQWDDDLDP